MPRVGYSEYRILEADIRVDFGVRTVRFGITLVQPTKFHTLMIYALMVAF